MGDRTDTKPTLFIVDDEPAITDALSALAPMRDLVAKVFSSANKFLQYAESEILSEPAYLIVDVRMPQMSGLDRLENLIASGKRLPAIVTTGHRADNLKLRAEELGVVAFLEKPFRPDRLKEIVQSALRMGNDPQQPH